MSGGSETSNKFEPPSWTSDRFPGAMGALDSLASSPYQQYQGMKIAPMSPYQHTAAELTADRALFGDPQLNTSRGSLMNIAGGGAMNPFMDNAYTDAMIANNAQDMAGAFATGTAANNDAMAARAGAYGGSGHLEKQRMDAAALAKQVGNMATATRQAEIGRKGALYQNDIGNILAAAGMAPTFSALDQSAFDSLNKYGGQEQNYMQSLLGEQYAEFQRQQAHPYTMMDWYLGGLAKGSGQYGTNFQNGPGTSPAAMGAGGLLAAYGLLS